MPAVWKRVLASLLSRVGYDVRPSRTWRAEHLRGLGFRPATLFDVGVLRGTPVLYESFPDAYLVLVEPLLEMRPHLEPLLARRAGRWIATAVGSQPGHATLHVEPHKMGKSSLATRTSLTTTGATLEPREVPVTTLDAILEDEGSFQAPFGLKIDTEGFELEVIRGADRFLERTEFVIAEISVAPRFEGSYSFADFVEAMDARGFALCDFLGESRTPEGVLRFVDGVFRRKATA